MKDYPRRLLIGGIALLLVVGLVVAGSRLFLRSSYAAAQAAAQLQAILGEPVQIEEADLGLTSPSSIRGLRLYEAGAESAFPWAVVAEARTDTGTLNLLRGVMPRQLTLSGASLVLHFDQEGRLLTRLPQGEDRARSIPDIDIDNGQVTLRQDGRPEMVIRGITARLRQDGEGLSLAGTINDPDLGDWSVQLATNSPAGVRSITLRTAHVCVTPERLQSVPFVAPVVWQHVQGVQGTGGIDITVQIGPAPNSTHYRVVIAAESLRGYLDDVDLHVEQVRGLITIEDGIIQLRDIQGNAAGGEVRVSGKLDLHDTPEQFQFVTRVTNLDVRRLPPKWGLPPKLTGRLTGQGDLRITTDQGRVRTSGQGEGVITDAHIAGLPADPITLKLHADGKRFHFTQHLSPQGVKAEALLPALMLVAGQAADPAPPLVTDWLTRGAQWLERGIAWIGGGIKESADWLATQVKRKPSQPGPEPNYLEANLRLRDVELQQLLKSLDVSVPFPISGRITIQVQAAIPVDTPGDLKKYRLRGEADLPDLTLAGIHVEQVKARVTYTDGVLQLEQLTGRLPAAESVAGTFQGTARLEVIPRGKFNARLALHEIPLNQVLAVVPGAAEGAAGSLSGVVEAEVPADRLQEVAAWQVLGRITAKQVRAYGWILNDAGASVRLRRGALTLAGIRGSLEGAAVTGQVNLEVAAPYPFRGDVALANVDLTTLQRLAPELRPPVTIAGGFRAMAELRGTLQPLALTTEGDGAAEALKVANFRLGNLKFHWESDARRLRLTNVQAVVGRGEVTGSATVPLQAAEPGDINLHLQNVDVGDLGRDVAAMPFHLEGQANGRVTGKFAEKRPGQDRELTAEMDLQAQRLRVQGIPTEGLRGTLNYRQGVLGYHFEGQSLGGTFELEGQVPPAKPRPAPALPEQRPPDARSGTGEGHLRVREANLERLWEALGMRESLGPLRGTVDLLVDFRQSGWDEPPTGTGLFRINQLSWKNTELAGTLQGEARLTAGELRLLNVSGAFAKGLLNGQVGLNLRDANRSWFTLSLQGAPASHLLAPWPAVAAVVEGPLDVRLRGRLGRACAGGGDLVLARGKVLGVEVADWRLPVAFEFAPARGRGRLELSDSNAQVALGRLTGRASLSLGVEGRLEGQIRFHDVDLRNLIRQVEQTSDVGEGRMTGRIDFGGGNVQSLNDVIATVEASFQQARAMDFPVLKQLTPYVGMGSSSATFQSGDLRGRLAGGVFRIQRFSLTGSRLKLLVEGNVTLQGRLNLDVTANTGTVGINPNVPRLLGLRLPAAGPLPVTVLAQAGTYLSNRVIHLRVTGTIRNPTIQVEPLTLASEEIIRFFLNRTGLPIP